jgi:hypothetical protein
LDIISVVPVSHYTSRLDQPVLKGIPHNGIADHRNLSGNEFV